MARIQIFRPGRHTSRDGRTLTFTAEQLAACAAAYDPALAEAPIVIGHPAENAPAYGWVKSLQFSGGVLEAEPHQVEAQFAEMVKDGRFKKVSASFYLPDAPENPKPGTLYLRHVGFLGAQPPAVRGLKSASFAAAGAGVVEFTDWGGMTIAGLFRRIKNWLIEQAGQEKADAVLPEYEIESLTVSAAKKDEPAPAYAEHTEGDDVDKQELERRQAQLRADQEKLERERAELAEREKRLRAEEAAAARARTLAACGAFVDEQVKAGRVLPAHRDGLVAFMAALPADGVVEFGEGDKATKKPSAEWLREYLKAQPRIVDFAERARPDGAAPPEGAEAIAKAALEFQENERKAGRTVSISEAVKHVTGGSK